MAGPKIVRNAGVAFDPSRSGADVDSYSLVCLTIWPLSQALGLFQNISYCLFPNNKDPRAALNLQGALVGAGHILATSI